MAVTSPLPRPRLLQRIPELAALHAAVGKWEFQGCGRNQAKTRSWEMVPAVQVTGRKKINFLRGGGFKFE